MNTETFFVVANVIFVIGTMALLKQVIHDKKICTILIMVVHA